MTPELAALLELHAGLPRQGPGDAAFTRRMLKKLPPLPASPRVADLGCGSGAAALVLAEELQAPVTAVDLAASFLAELNRKAAERGLGHLIHTVEADMGALDWPAESLDLLWSEGAAYQLTFAGALKTWRPLLPVGGLAVISELTLFVEPLPEEVRKFWSAGYPTAGSDAENARRAVSAGYNVLGVERLPEDAWWENYYGPLERRVEALRPAASPTMLSVIAETESEIDLFRRYGESYGYSFYLLRAV